MESKSFTVIFEKKTVNFEVVVDDFSIKEFDSWVRSRFALVSGERFRCIDNKGKEILLSKTFLLNNTKLIVEREGNASTRAPIKSTFTETMDYISMCVYVGIPLILAWKCTHSTTNAFFPLVQLCNALDQYLIVLGVIQKAGVSIEACIACICWSTTYLFIRRLLNPENDGYASLQKFAADSFYGGVAAAMSVFVKAFLVAHLVNYS